MTNSNMKSEDFEDGNEDIFAVPDFANFKNSEPEECVYYKPLPKQNSFDAWKRFNAGNVFRNYNIEQTIIADQSIKFSIVTPVYNIEASILKECVNSVLQQSYPNWELLLIDDGSTKKETLDYLETVRFLDKRILVKYRKENGNISRASNDGIDMASGGYVIFLDNDDLLADHALAIAANHIHENDRPDLLYSNDARFKDDCSALYSPQFKPGWSPELLFAFCYISHLKIVSLDLCRKLEGFRVGFEGSQDHDFLLRASELAENIIHIPHILYLRRVLPTSTASSGHAKPYSFEAGRKASEEAFHRRGVKCRVIHPDWAREKGWGVYTPQMPDEGPSVTVLIPSRNNKSILERLLVSLEKTTYKNYKIFIIDNDSDDPDTCEYLQGLTHTVLKIPNSGDDFSFSYINNRAARQIDSEFVLFLNDDIEVISPNWLSQMVGWAQLSGVGAVGARLLFPNGDIQHGGVVPSLPRSVGRTAFRGLPGTNPGYLFGARVSKNCSAVTAACMLTPTKLFHEIGGFDEKNFAIAYNDIDYCLRLRDQGQRVVYCGEIELYYHVNRSHVLNKDRIQEMITYERKYGDFKDPYYDPNLSLEDNRANIKATVLPPQKNIQPIKLLAITHNLNAEGAPNSAFELVAGLHQKGGFEITVLSLQDGILRQKYEREGINIQISEERFDWHMPDDRYEDFLERFTNSVDLAAYDLVYVNTATLFWAIDAASRFHIPTIWNIRESESWKDYYGACSPSIATRALQCFSLPYRVLFVAKKTMLRWKPQETMDNFSVVSNSLSEKSIAHLKNGSDRKSAREAAGYRDDDIVLLNLGTVCPRKGQHDMLLAYLKLPPHIRKRVKLLFVGGRQSPYLDYLNSIVDKLPEEIRQSIRIIDETVDTSSYWQQADIFVCTSRLESYPRVILEAMAVGLPIITTLSYGIAEQVIENFNALIYSSGEIDDLAEKITELTENAKKRRELAANSLVALQLCTNYDEMMSRYHDIFTAAAFSSVPLQLGTLPIPVPSLMSEEQAALERKKISERSDGERRKKKRKWYSFLGIK